MALGCRLHGECARVRSGVLGCADDCVAIAVRRRRLPAHQPVQLVFLHDDRRARGARGRCAPRAGVGRDEDVGWHGAARPTTLALDDEPLPHVLALPARGVALLVPDAVARLRRAVTYGGAPAAMPSQGTFSDPRRGISVRTRWGWGPSAIGKKQTGWPH